MNDWHINRCIFCGAWGQIDLQCSTCSTIIPPTKGDAEMQNSINGGTR
jgi:hypothetical protein